MKTLVTGMTNLQTGHTGVDYEITLDVLKKALIASTGTEIEQRRIEIGEDLSGYDQIVVGITKTNGFAQSFRDMVALGWLFGRGAYRDKIVLEYDDWAAMHTVKDAEYALRTLDARLAYWNAKKETTSEQRAYVEHLLVGLTMPNFFRKSMIPAMPWVRSGNGAEELSSRYPRTRETLFWEPTPFSLAVQTSEKARVAPKRRQWVLAAVQNHKDWLDRLQLTWPVLEFGVKRQGQARLSESDVRLTYAESWGILAQKYPSPGQWRPRFFHAALADSIMLCDKADQAIMGEPYKLKRFQVEMAEDVALKEMALKQREWLFAQITPADQTKEQIRRFLES